MRAQSSSFFSGMKLVLVRHWSDAAFRYSAPGRGVTGRARMDRGGRERDPASGTTNPSVRRRRVRRRWEVRSAGCAVHRRRLAAEDSLCGRRRKDMGRRQRLVRKYHHRVQRVLNAYCPLDDGIAYSHHRPPSSREERYVQNGSESRSSRHVAQDSHAPNGAGWGSRLSIRRSALCQGADGMVIHRLVAIRLDAGDARGGCQAASGCGSVCGANGVPSARRLSAGAVTLASHCKRLSDPRGNDGAAVHTRRYAAMRTAS